MNMTLFTADVVSDAKNCLYPNRVMVSCAEELHEAVRFDHVCAEFRSSYRSNSNFVSSDVLVMDCDNDHSDDPAEWITAERPKFHVHFEIGEVTDPSRYAALKAAPTTEII